MIAPMLSFILLLVAFIIVNSTPSISRQTSIFDCFRNEKRGPSKINLFSRFQQTQFLTPKEHVFDKPIYLKYGSTGRPPGKYHLRHSSKELTNISEFPYPPIDINNTNNSIIGNDNGGTCIADNKGVSFGIRSGAKADIDIVIDNDNDLDTDVVLGLMEWFMNQFKVNHHLYYNNKFDTSLSPSYKYNISYVPNKTNNFGIFSTTALRYDHYKYDVIVSDCTGSHYTNFNTISNNNKKFDTSSSTYTTNAYSNTTTSTIYIYISPYSNYNTIDKHDRNVSTIHHMDNNNGSDVSYPSTTTSTTNNNNETFHLSFMFKLISLYLIITKSNLSKEFTKQPKSNHHYHQQQHYHGKRRHQFHLEQQQKHQYFKQEQHNVERMAASIVLKLALVAWDMWTYRNGF